MFLNLNYVLGWEDKSNMTGPSLMIAAILGGHPDIVEALIEAGVNVNQSTDDGLLPLNVAVGVRNVKITEILLKNKADVNAVSDGHVFPPLLEAIRAPRFAEKEEEDQKFLNVFIIVKLLLAYGADANCRAGGNDTKMIYTPLTLAARSCFPYDIDGSDGMLSVVKILLNKGADPYTPCTKDFWEGSHTPRFPKNLFSSDNVSIPLVDMLSEISDRRKLNRKPTDELDIVDYLSDYLRDQVRRTILHCLTKAEIPPNDKSSICTTLFESTLFHVKLLELATDFVVEKPGSAAAVAPVETRILPEELSLEEDLSSADESDDLLSLEEASYEESSDDEVPTANNPLKRGNSGGAGGVYKRVRRH